MNQKKKPIDVKSGDSEVGAKQSCLFSPSSTPKTSHWKQCCRSEVTQQCRCNEVALQIAVKFHVCLLANVERRSSPAYVSRALVGLTEQNVLHLPYSVRYITHKFSTQERMTLQLAQTFWVNHQLDILLLSICMYNTATPFLTNYSLTKPQDGWADNVHICLPMWKCQATTLTCYH
jgi:hypothetical protein